MLPCYACNNVPTIVTPHRQPAPRVCVRVENIVKQLHGRDIEREFLAVQADSPLYIAKENNAAQLMGNEWQNSFAYYK